MKSRLNTGLARLRVKVLKDASGKPMPQSTAARMLEIPLPTYVAYEKGARRISRRIAEKASATWHVSPDYLMQAPPEGDPISVAGEALTWQVAQRASMMNPSISLPLATCLASMSGLNAMRNFWA
jgi:hypothetical protein